MSYRIEFAQNPDEAFYQEIVMVNRYTGESLPGTGINHCFTVFAARRDYGIWGQFGQVLASNTNGLITAPAPGVIAISIPPAAFCGYTQLDDGIWVEGFDRRRSLRYRLTAVPADATLTKTIATGTITFGDRTMDPRITLQAYPLYPAPAVPIVDATQVKIQLAKVAGNYDAVEAALLGPTDPSTITWNTGGAVTLGGPLANVIATALGFDVVAMTIFLNAAAANQT